MNLDFMWPANCGYFSIAAAIANLFLFAMRILVTGICGFVGSTLARVMRESLGGAEIFGIDNFIRPGSEVNRSALLDLGIPIYHADIRNPSDIEMLPGANWLIDASANPSVLAGVE